MKKTFLALAAMGAMSLSACTSTEVIQEGNPGNAIGFSNVINKHTRANDLDNTSFDTFLVYGYYTKPNMTTPVQIFNETEVKKNTIDGKTEWTYDGVRYWMPGYNYKFYAYSCGDIKIASGKGQVAMDLTVDPIVLKISDYICDDTHQHDLVCAASDVIEGKNSGNDEVALKFNHTLCKIGAEFTTDFPIGYKIEISDVRVTNFYNQADLNVATTTWADYKKIVKDEDTPTTVTFQLPDNKTITNAEGSKVATSYVFMMPKKYEESEDTVELHFHLTIKMDDTVILERNMKGSWRPQWQSAYAYLYKVNINGDAAGIEAIKFSAEQTLSDGTSWGNTEAVHMEFDIDSQNNQ